MTYLEKVLSENAFLMDEVTLVNSYCPHHFLSCNTSIRDCDHSCVECWNGEYCEAKDAGLSCNECPKTLSCDTCVHRNDAQWCEANCVDKDEYSPKVADSGNRREFESGAVRDIQEGKGRCDLLPLGVVATIGEWPELRRIQAFLDSGHPKDLESALVCFVKNGGFGSIADMFLEVSILFEDGAKKYGERNWEKGIPVHSYIDSAVRHFLKFMRGDKDERHDRAFCWNILCAMWTCAYKPELNDYRKEDENANQ